MFLVEGTRPSLRRLYSLRKPRNDSFKKRRLSVSGSYRRTHRMAEGGVNQSGYIDIKQPPRVKSRKLKSWRRKWVVLQEMSICSAGGRPAAKVDVYSDQQTAITTPADKQTFIFEYVTDVRPAKSKTRVHAFEVVEGEPVLLIAGNNALTAQEWKTAFCRIFWPDKTVCDTFTVQLEENAHTRRLVLQGTFTMTVTPETLAIVSQQHNSYEWSLHMLKRFHVQKDAQRPDTDLLIIECGPKSECGEAVFKFTSENVVQILASIRRNIQVAIDKQKAEDRLKPSDTQAKQLTISDTGSPISGRSRAETTSSTEKRYRELLENTGVTPMDAMPRTKSLYSHDSLESEESQASENPEQAPELPKKKRASVTFNKSVFEDSKSTSDLLSTPNDMSVAETVDSEYNTVTMSSTTNTPKPNIISMMTVSRPGYETTKVLLDDGGYSHIDISNKKPVIKDDSKGRSSSSVSNRSSVSGRSASVGSRDSGVHLTSGDQAPGNEPGRQSNRSTNSFDSAVSTSSVVETSEGTPGVTTNVNITVEIEAVELSREELEASTGNAIIEENEHSIYQDVKIDDDAKDTHDTSVEYAKTDMKKSKSASNVKRSDENEYEDLDSVRKGKKNLAKHLGLDPKVDPTSVPPSLPARPSSYRIKRKSYQPEKNKLFTLPFLARHRKSRGRTASLSSSSSSSDDGKSGELAVKAWPLGNTSVTAANEDLYEPMERFLKDSSGAAGPQKRERSCSLNLNTGLELKRPSVSSSQDISSLERRNVMWTHNRNVSMHIDQMNRARDPNDTMFNTTFPSQCDVSLMPELLTDRSCIEVIEDQIIDYSDGDGMHTDNEPIYAEVAPARCSGASTSIADDNPFPNLSTWQPQDISEVAEESELNGTVYENNESMTNALNDSMTNVFNDSTNNPKTDDMFNQGFVFEEEKENVSMEKRNSFGFAADLSKADVSQNNSHSGIDIFSMGIGNCFLSQPLEPTRSNVSKTTALNSPGVKCTTSLDASMANVDVSRAAQEDIYMDMSTVARNESIYVMPSELKRTGQ